MTIDIVVPEAAKRTYETFHFAPAVRHAGLLLCSGVIGADASGKVPEDPEAEFRNAWNGVGATLSEAGLSFDDILELTSYHVGLQEHLRTFVKVKDEFVSAPYPAWTAIGCTELAIPGARVEIRITARTE